MSSSNIPSHSDISQDRSVLVLYGSETGTAADLALSVAQTAQRLHFTVCVDELDAVELVSGRFPGLEVSLCSICEVAHH